MTLGLIAIFVSLPPQPLSAADQTKWRGAFFYSDGRAPVQFELDMQQTGMAITGRMTEPATFGDRKVPYLYANVAGTLNGSAISFIKTYDGTGGVSHSVFYSGTVVAGGTQMSGRWWINNDQGQTSVSGTFSATSMDAKAPRPK